MVSELVKEDSGNGRAQEQVYGEFGDADGQRFQTGCLENHLAPYQDLAARMVHEEQSRRGIQEWGDAILTDGDANGHVDLEGRYRIQTEVDLDYAVASMSLTLGHCPMKSRGLR